MVEDFVREANGTLIFLDLKLHDIPATVGRTAKVASNLGVDYLSVHVDGGRAIKATVGAVEDACGILGITVLTSITDADLLHDGNQYTAETLVSKRAICAVDAGAAGVVCSGKEVGILCTLLGDYPLLVVPGVRMPDGDIADQKRVVTLQKAMEYADMIVVGRPIREALDPVAAANAILENIG